jgi:uncharacterized membrane protein YagU involved in acid resistance
VPQLSATEEFVMERFDRDDRETGLASDMLRGVVAGLVATWVMDRVDWFMVRREPEASRRLTWEVRPRHMDPAHVIAAEATEAAGVALSSRQLDTAGIAVHYAIGIAPAAVYGALRGRVPGVDAGAGLAYGLAVFALEDEIANPALGFAAPPGRYPWQPHARGLVAHLVYGFATEMLLRAMDPARGRRRGRDRRR